MIGVFEREPRVEMVAFLLETSVIIDALNNRRAARLAELKRNFARKDAAEFGRRHRRCRRHPLRADLAYR
jgi:hypothetical protein